jgi:hypothetical protein
LIETANAMMRPRTGAGRGMPRNFFWPAFVAGVLLIPAAIAQVPGSVIRGRVTDATGAAISGASVRVIDSRTGVEQQRTAATANGEFSVTGLKPGSYSLAASAMGFATVRLESIAVDSEKGADVPITLKLGSTVPVLLQVEIDPAVAPADLRSFTSIAPATGLRIQLCDLFPDRTALVWDGSHIQWKNALNEDVPPPGMPAPAAASGKKEK